MSSYVGAIRRSVTVPLVFVKISKRHTHDKMVFLKRTIIILNKSRNFTVQDRYCLHLLQTINDCVQYYLFIPRHFEVCMEDPATSVLVSFEIVEDTSWQNSI